MKARLLVSLAALCCLILPSPASIHPAIQAMNPGAISASNATGFAAPPSTAVPWSTSSYVPIQGGGTVWISLTSTAGSMTLHLYSSPQGGATGLLIQWPDSAIYRVGTQTFGPINAAASDVYVVNLPPGANYLACSAYTSGSVSAYAFPGPVFGVPTGGSSQPVGSSANLIAARISTASGSYATGAHSVCSVIAENASATSVYVQIYDATSQPANGTVPVFEFVLPFGISTSPTRAYPPISPNFLSFSTGIYVVLSTSYGTMNSANIASATGIVIGFGGK